MTFRITYYFENNAKLTLVEDIFYDEKVEYGDWKRPFPNELAHSFAYGMVESFEQSDLGSAVISICGKVIRVKVEEGGGT